MAEAFIVEAVRTPVGKRNGSLRLRNWRLRSATVTIPWNRLSTFRTSTKPPATIFGIASKRAAFDQTSSAGTTQSLTVFAVRPSAWVVAMLAQVTAPLRSRSAWMTGSCEKSLSIIKVTASLRGVFGGTDTTGWFAADSRPIR